MAYIVGANPGAVYTEDDVAKGKCPVVGTIAEMTVAQTTGPCTGTYIMCKAGASQNLVLGHVVSIGRAAGGAAATGDWVAVVTPANAPTSSALGSTLGVAICSITASASMQLWVQVYGRSVVKASLSQNPNIPLQVGTTAGVVTGTAAASASGIVEGMILLNTSSVQGAICACFLNWPHFGGSVKGA